MKCGSSTVLNQSPLTSSQRLKYLPSNAHRPVVHTTQTSQPNTIIKPVVNHEILSHPNTDEGVREREMLFSTNAHLHGGDSRQIDQSIL